MTNQAPPEHRLHPGGELSSKAELFAAPSIVNRLNVSRWLAPRLSMRVVALKKGNIHHFAVPPKRGW